MEKSKSPRSSGRISKSRPCKRKKLAQLKATKRWTNNNNDDVNDENAKTTSSSAWKEPSTSASQKKLSSFQTNQSDTVPELDSLPNSDDSNEFILIHKSVLPNIVKSFMCSECNENSITVQTVREIGFAAEIEVLCSSCKTSVSKMFTSPNVEQSKQFVVNKKMVESFLSVGQGSNSLDRFCMTMGMNNISRKTFSGYEKCLVTDNIEVINRVLQKSRNTVREAYEEENPSLKSEEVIDISVSFDGTWQKRGHTSLYGIGFVIDAFTGLVVDYHILSKYCPLCTANQHKFRNDPSKFREWYNLHKNDCEKNFDGSSNAMEMNIAETLWRRSVDSCKMRYTTMVSDGDSKAHVLLQNMEVYGPDVEITKEECLNHVAKRLGTALRNCVKEWRIKGLRLGGQKKGSLTDEVIKILPNYYRKALKDNIPNMDNMKSAVFATLYHCMSTDTKPQHHKCPGGDKSWCFYNRAIAANEPPKSHNEMKTFLREEVVAKMIPIYQRLASTELLSRCCLGKTQNANESLHGVLWSKCSKTVFVSKKRLNLAVISTVSEFNMGVSASLLLKESCSQDINNISFKIAQRKDAERVSLSNKRMTKRAKLARLKLKRMKKKSESKKQKSEGLSYGSGLFP